MINLLTKIRVLIFKKHIIKDDLFFLGTFAFCLSCVCGIFLYTMYDNHQEVMKKEISINANRIDNIISDIFNETNFFMVYIGKQISKHGNQDLNFINQLLKNKKGSEYKNNHILSWTLFDWVSPDNHQVVNHQGIISQPLDVSHREYSWKCRKHPWTLQVSRPAVGNPSGEWVIPAGTGVTDTNGKFLGMIVVGFNIPELNEILEKKLIDYEKSFIILDERYNIVLKSSDNVIDNNSDYYKNKLINTKLFKTSSGFLKSPISFEPLKYIYYKKMKYYPYIILTGFDARIINKELYDLFLPRIVELLCMSLFFLVFLYLYRFKMIKLSSSSEKAKIDFIRNINQQLHHYIDIIYHYSNVLLKYFKGNIDIGVTRERQIEFMSCIQEAATNLRTFTSSSLNFTYIDTQRVIKDAIMIQSHRALLKNVVLIERVQSNLPLFYADEFSFKQVIVGLISQSLDRISKEGSIKVEIFRERDKKTENLVIIITDDGFALSEEELTHIKQKFDTGSVNNNYGIDIDMASILKLVQLHGGTCERQDTQGKGGMVILKFPYVSPTSTSKELFSKPEDSQTYGKLFRSRS